MPTYSVCQGWHVWSGVEADTPRDAARQITRAPNLRKDQAIRVVDGQGNTVKRFSVLQPRAQLRGGDGDQELQLELQLHYQKVMKLK